MSTHGPHDPSSGTPVRRPGSVRRTSSIDMTWPDGLRSPRFQLTGRARDLRTDADGQRHVVDEVALQAEVDRSDGSRLSSLDVQPEFAPKGDLIGVRVGTGFRAVVARTLPEHERERTALFLLLDDLPVAALISGYAYQLDPEFGPNIRVQSPPRDLCAGWAGDATMMAAIDAGHPLPLATGPIASDLTADDDWAWHELPAMPPISMRRRRRLDVWTADGWQIDAMFRDSWVGPDGVETVVHEYTTMALVDPDTHTVVAIEATPRVLPWPECPAAVASALRLVGTPVDDLRTRVRADFTGTSTCTHLNDMLRSLTDVPALADQI
ncbi:MAG: DUF2889 domain-containing protein [Actinomycetes bacterium]